MPIMVLHSFQGTMVGGTSRRQPRQTDYSGSALFSDALRAIQVGFVTLFIALLTGVAETDRIAEQLLAFYASSLQETFGDQYCPPSLSQLSKFWYHSLREQLNSYPYGLFQLGSHQPKFGSQHAPCLKRR